MPNERLMVFVKAPRPGEVKTRVAQTTGAERACDVYRQLVATLLKSLSPLREVELRFAPDDAAAEIEPWLRPGWVAVPQGDGDLGARLERAFADAFAAGAERVVIVGSDCPDVKTSDVRTAWRELQTHDVAVGPAMDGGYWLIGLRAPQPELFRGIPWSSELVLGRTLERARALGLKIQLLRILSDIDTEADWNAHVRGDE
jgi:rSAM/selenodomain-associated transferase 1